MEFLPYANIIKLTDEELEFLIGKIDEKNAIQKLFEISKDAKRLASMTLAPRPQVMLFLEQQGLRKYSMGSYWC